MKRQVASICWKIQQAIYSKHLVQGQGICLNHNGTRDVIAEGLFLPTAMTYESDDNLYVSNGGFVRDMKDGNW
ncbi:MAG TPA: hypothetical protein VLC28_16665 [Flavitalea sp.]|nr:hypothetical protein [Flavitalea sp.]